MARYHINKKGVPAICHAQSGKCPLGGTNEHYPSAEAAQSAIDKQNAQNFAIESDFKTAAKHALSGEVNRKDIRDFGKMDDDTVLKLEDKYEFGSHRDSEKLVRIASISDLSDNYDKIKDLPKGKYVHMCEHVEDVPGRTDWVDVSGALITVAPYTEKLAKSDDTTLIFNL